MEGVGREMCQSIRITLHAAVRFDVRGIQRHCSGRSGNPATSRTFAAKFPARSRVLKGLYTVVYGQYSGGQSYQRHAGSAHA